MGKGADQNTKFSRKKRKHEKNKAPNAFKNHSLRNWGIGIGIGLAITAVVFSKWFYDDLSTKGGQNARNPKPIGLTTKDAFGKAGEIFKPSEEMRRFAKGISGTDYEIARKVYEFAAYSMAYDFGRLGNRPSGPYTGQEAFANMEGDCNEKSYATVAILRLKNIPALMASPSRLFLKERNGTPVYHNCVAALVRGEAEHCSTRFEKDKNYREKVLANFGVQDSPDLHLVIIDPVLKNPGFEYKELSIYSDKEAEAGYLLEAGAMCSNAGFCDKAIGVLKQVVAANPENAGAWYKLGMLYYYDAKDYREAVNAFKKAVAADPVFAMAWNNLGSAFVQTESMKEAEKAFKKAIELYSPSEDKKVLQGVQDLQECAYTLGLKNLGLVYGYEGRYEEAAKQWSKLAPFLEKTGDYKNAASAYYDLCICHSNAKQYEQALKACRKALEICRQQNIHLETEKKLLKLDYALTEACM